MSASAIAVERLVKRYGEVEAVAGIDLTIPTGEVFALLGPNGAGKTTTVEILEGLRRATSGHAEVLGHEVGAAQDAVRDRIGILPQNFEPFDRLTPEEAVTYWARLFGRALSASDSRGLIAQVGLDERRRVQGRNLSGGEKRKVGIALALVSHPDLLFLDEPTTGLDPRARRDIWSLVESVRKEGRTVFLTTHYLDEAEHLADDVGILMRGHLIARGSPGELIRDLGGATTVVLEGASPEVVEKVQALGHPAEFRDGTVTVRVPDPFAMQETLRELTSLDVPFSNVYTRRGTLDDVFLSLVGRRMEEGVLQA